MDQEILVADEQKVVTQLEQSEGPTRLAMLLASDYEPHDSWNFIVSTRGLDKTSRAESVRLVTDLIRRNVNKSHWSAIMQTTVLKTDDPFVKAINQVFGTTRVPINIENRNISGTFINKAILLKSTK